MREGQCVCVNVGESTYEIVNERQIMHLWVCRYVRVRESLPMEQNTQVRLYMREGYYVCVRERDGESTNETEHIGEIVYERQVRLCMREGQCVCVQVCMWESLPMEQNTQVRLYVREGQCVCVQVCERESTYNTEHIGEIVYERQIVCMYVRESLPMEQNTQVRLYMRE